MERSQMSNVLHSAGEPGTPRCSDGDTGSGSKASREALRRARWLEERRKSRFPCVAQSYGPGQVAGLAFLGELLRSARSSIDTEREHAARLNLRDCVAEVGRVMDIPDVGHGPTRQHAAYAFMDAVAELLMSASRFTDWESFLKARTEAAEADGAQWQAILDEEKAAFVSRMLVARAAKAAKRGQATGGAQ